MNDPTNATAAVDLAHPERSRLLGIACLVLGAIPIGMNEYFLRSDGTFYPKLYIFAGALLPVGLFGLGFGLPTSRKLDGQPLGYKVGYCASAIAGCAAGFAYSIHLGG